MGLLLLLCIVVDCSIGDMVVVKVFYSIIVLVFSSVVVVVWCLLNVSVVSKVNVVVSLVILMMMVFLG